MDITEHLTTRVKLTKHSTLAIISQCAVVASLGWVSPGVVRPPPVTPLQCCICVLITLYSCNMQSRHSRYRHNYIYYGNQLTLNDNASRPLLRLHRSANHSADPWTLQISFVDNIQWLLRCMQPLRVTFMQTDDS